ncbi:hypothetical protein GE061_012709 [Apolygus lucorum]|uniref:Gustatory receptor n=1 Tax=Apolygus lucorum TaxID=248454 RepID=A0A8S9XVB1_APOLU|nr:hypothetical protein GE061_012709 [Apolygus lucorum]
MSTRKRISRIVIPYGKSFKRQNAKIVIILLISLLVPFPGIRNVYIQNETHVTLLLLQYSEMGLVSLTGFICYLWTAKKVKSLSKIYRNILLTHRLFYVFQKRSISYNTKWMDMYDVLVVVAVIVNTASGILDPNIEQKPKNSLLFIILGSLSYSVPVVLVHCLGTFFRTSFFALNVQLIHLNHLLDNVNVLNTTHIEKLVYIHCLIANSFRRLNAAHMLPVLLLSSCTFFVVVYNLYDMLTFNLEESLNNTLGDNVGGAAWLTFWTTQLIVLVILIENVVDKHDEFSSRLHYIIIQDPTGILGKSNRLMAHLAIRQRLEYSAAGFFTVGYKLIASIASSATTYLVILIQFAQINVGSQKVPGVDNKTSSSTTGPTTELMILK